MDPINTTHPEYREIYRDFFCSIGEIILFSQDIEDLVDIIYNRIHRTVKKNDYFDKKVKTIKNYFKYHELNNVWNEIEYKIIKLRDIRNNITHSKLCMNQEFTLKIADDGKYETEIFEPIFLLKKSKNGKKHEYKTDYIRTELGKVHEVRGKLIDIIKNMK